MGRRKQGWRLNNDFRRWGPVGIFVKDWGYFLGEDVQTISTPPPLMRALERLVRSIKLRAQWARLHFDKQTKTYLSAYIAPKIGNKRRSTLCLDRVSEPLQRRIMVHLHYPFYFLRILIIYKLRRLLRPFFFEMFCLDFFIIGCRRAVWTFEGHDERKRHGVGDRRGRVLMLQLLWKSMVGTGT